MPGDGTWRRSPRSSPVRAGHHRHPRRRCCAGYACGPDRVGAFPVVAFARYGQRRACGRTGAPRSPPRATVQRAHRVLDESTGPLGGPERALRPDVAGRPRALNGRADRRCAAMTDDTDSPPARPATSRRRAGQPGRGDLDLRRAPRERRQAVLRLAGRSRPGAVLREGSGEHDRRPVRRDGDPRRRPGLAVPRGRATPANTSTRPPAGRWKPSTSPPARLLAAQPGTATTPAARPSTTRCSP